MSSNISTTSSISFATRKKKYRETLEHFCTLPPEEDVLVRYINSGYFVNLRRKIKNLLIVSEKNPRSQACLKSMASVRFEKKRHLQYYYYMIHPFSMGRAYWEFFIMFTLMVALLYTPFEMASGKTQLRLFVPKLMLDLFFLADVVINFLTGYYEKTTKLVVLNQRKVFWKYLTTLFLFDFLSSMNATVLLYIFKPRGGRVFYIKFIGYLKLMRIPTILVYLDRFREWKQSSLYMMKTFKLIIIPFIFLLWLSCLVYYVAMHYQEQWLIQHLQSDMLDFFFCFVRLFQTFLLIGNDNASPTSFLNLIIEMATLAAGAIFQVFVMSQILQIVNKYNSSSNKYFQMIQSLREYASYMRLPDYLKSKMINYFDFKFQKCYYKENEIMSTISEHLRDSIVIHTCKSLIASVELFNDLPATLLVRIVTCMKSEIYLPGDVIVQAGIEGDSMFFISAGTVAIYTSLGKEVCHLADGNHFGEIALVMEGEKRVASVIAVDPCELFNLSRKDFHKAIEPYPDLYFRIRKIAQDRIVKTLAELEKQKKTQVQFGHPESPKGSLGDPYHERAPNPLLYLNPEELSKKRKTIDNTSYFLR